jgi:hypothetical protein
MSANEKRFEILQKVEKGEISPDEASRYLDELDDDELVVQSIHSPETSPEAIPTQVASQPIEVIPPPVGAKGEIPFAINNERLKYWKVWWLFPLSIGIIFTLLGAYWMYRGYLLAGFGWGFWFSWFPFGFGVLVTALSAGGRTSRWVHVRVTQKPGKKPGKIAISFPLVMATWIVNIVAQFKGGNKDMGRFNEVMYTVNQALNSDEPMHVQVNEKDGEEVEVYIG